MDIQIQIIYIQKHKGCLKQEKYNLRMLPKFKEFPLEVL